MTHSFLFALACYRALLTSSIDWPTDFSSAYFDNLSSIDRPSEPSSRSVSFSLSKLGRLDPATSSYFLLSLSLITYLDSLSFTSRAKILFSSSSKLFNWYCLNAFYYKLQPLCISKKCSNSSLVISSFLSL